MWTIRGSLDHAEALELIADSRSLVNASWVEVQSLVDLRLAHLGTECLRAEWELA